MVNVTKVTCKCSKWVVDIYEFNEDSIESYDDKSDEEFFS